ncbi:SSrecog-domain-containing protein [Cristinia sonorae]|uniref:FACT complex subunit POB3 n=1 Tax=Cristinia sonorae TaxID=1940300 RepID=A0A8K0UEJ8_9AGAR|nr:SSrecog-domain-containing protein [Cristinia sonorae]
MTTEFVRIYNGLGPEVGKIRIASSGIGWKGDETNALTAFAAGDIKWAQWIRVARNFQLRIGLKDRTRATFDGFAREDHDKLAQLMKQHFSVTLETKETSFKGWNWGVTDFQGQDLAFLVSNKTSFELPLTHVANSNIAGRTEVSLEFAAPSSKKASKSSPDEMVEIRFYVPGTRAKEPRGSDAGSQPSDDDDGEEVSAAQAFHDAVKEKAEIGQVAGDIILSFEEVNVLTPRGRYDVDMFPEFLRLRGKTYDYKIMFSSISKLFLLPKDDLHVLFILALNTPIRQGQTRYQYLVMQFSREEEITAELNLSEDEIAKYDRLQKSYEAPTFEVVSGVFRALSGKKIVGAGSFQSRDGHPGIKANLKAVQGDLFMLEKYIFFVSKQPTLIELSDIYQVVFSRLGAGMGATAARTFDLKIVTKSGPEYSFTSVNKEEHEITETYLKEKKVKVKNEMMEGELIMNVDDDDEEMQSVASSGEEAPKPRMGGDDDDSEEDEDFEASSSDAGSPSESDDSDEGGQTASDASGDRDFMKSKGKGKAAKKKAPAKKSKGSADSDAEEDAPKKKAAPKPKPKPKAKKDDSAMDVDDDGKDKEKPKAKPRPKPTPKNRKEDDDDGPAKKKLKKGDD